YMKGLHVGNDQDTFDYEYDYHGKKGRNNVWSAKTNIQESDESLLPHMESTLELVLEKRLESRMSELASQVMNHAIDTTMLSVLATKDDDIFERTRKSEDLSADCQLMADDQQNT
ncbi:hypothetical protein HAX54_040512, partial [Datura stramonium]|nr:hypothetical protein [Datura stramonium]